MKTLTSQLEERIDRSARLITRASSDDVSERVWLELHGLVAQVVLDVERAVGLLTPNSRHTGSVRSALDAVRETSTDLLRRAVRQRFATENGDG